MRNRWAIDTTQVVLGLREGLSDPYNVVLADVLINVPTGSYGDSEGSHWYIPKDANIHLKRAFIPAHEKASSDPGSCAYNYIIFKVIFVWCSTQPQQ